MTSWIDKLPIERMSRKAFDSLGEYSCSIPTGQRIGKVWKWNLHAFVHPPLPPLWLICEYVSHADPTKIGIDYRRVAIEHEEPPCT